MNLLFSRHGRAKLTGIKEQGNSKQYRALLKQDITRRFKAFKNRRGRLTAIEAIFASKTTEENAIPSPLYKAERIKARGLLLGLRPGVYSSLIFMYLCNLFLITVIDAHWA